MIENSRSTLEEIDMSHACDPEPDDTEREHQEELIDETEGESFPASDPPSTGDFT